MKLSKEQTEKLVAHLNKFAPVTECSICRSRNWRVADTIFEIRDFNNGDFVIGGPIYPVIPITCSNCGNTFFLNPLASGITLPPSPNAESQELPNSGSEEE